MFYRCTHMTTVGVKGLIGLCVCDGVAAGNGGYLAAPVPAHQPLSLPPCRPVLSPTTGSVSVPCHGWTPPPGFLGNARPPYPCETEPCCPVVSPYPSPPLSTHSRPNSGADMRWSPVSQLGADDSWSCADFQTGNQLTSSFPVDSSDVMPGDLDLDLDLGHGTSRQSVLTTYTGLLYTIMFIMTTFVRYSVVYSLL